ncbi:hypothetical protein U1Q18_048964 [Sarracenia purpurea var. burkii]
MLSTALILSILLFQSPAWITAKPTDAFIELTKQPYYVDKTELLHVISAFHNNYDFVACPSRFLKSSNLQMIKSFYRYEFDNNGQPKPYTETETFAFFKKFKISNHSVAFLKNRMANHPVLLIDLKFDVSQVKTIAQVDALLNTKLREAFQEYFEILPKLPTPTGEFEITKFETEFLQKLQKGTATHFELSYGLYRLSNVLHKYFKRRVIILIDDYDHAANQAVLKHDLLLDTDGPVYYFYTSISNMFRKTFKQNRKTKNYAMMTGISGRIEYADKDVTENQFLDDHVFSPYFGFTEIDVDNLLTKYNRPYGEFNQVKTYYKGYLTRLKTYHLFSPYSIVQSALSTKAVPEKHTKLEPYWTRTENHDFIKRALKSDNFRQKLRKLVDDVSVRVNISDYHKSSPALDTFVSTINERKATFKGIHQIEDEHLFHHMLEIGYLSHSSAKNDGPQAYCLPNSEIREGLAKIFDEIENKKNGDENKNDDQVTNAPEKNSKESFVAIRE